MDKMLPPSHTKMFQTQLLKLELIYFARMGLTYLLTASSSGMLIWFVSDFFQYKFKI